MVQPLRIDHHGWQLAFLALGLAGLADPDRRRGGIVTGLASAGSLAIGLEMLIYLALMGAAHVLFWVADRDERARLFAYAVSLSGGTVAAFLLFASYANRAAVCDALVAGVAGRRAGRRGADGRAGDGAGRALDGAAGARGGRRGAGAGVPRARLRRNA